MSGAPDSTPEEEEYVRLGGSAPRQFHWFNGDMNAMQNWRKKYMQPLPATTTVAASSSITTSNRDTLLSKQKEGGKKNKLKKTPKKNSSSGDEQREKSTNKLTKKSSTTNSSKSATVVAAGDKKRTPKKSVKKTDPKTSVKFKRSKKNGDDLDRALNADGKDAESQMTKVEKENDERGGRGNDNHNCDGSTGPGTNTGEHFEFEESDMPLPPLYIIKDELSQDKWVLLSDLCNLLKVKSKDTLLNKVCSCCPTFPLKFSGYFPLHKMLLSNSRFIHRQVRKVFVKGTSCVK